MGHRCNYTFSVKSNESEVYVKVTAHYKNMRAYIYRENWDGEALGRYLYYTHLAGYLVIFPNEKVTGYLRNYFGDVMQKSPLIPYEHFRMFGHWNTREKDIADLRIKRPELKYFLDKQQISNPFEFIEACKNYLKHPESETLYAMNLWRLAKNEKLYALPIAKRKRVMQIIKENRDLIYDETTLRDIWTIGRIGMTYGEFIRQRRTIPSTAEGLAQFRISEGLKDYNKNEKVIGAYTMFIPNDYATCEKQAYALDQCIIACDYVKDMAKKRLVLIFVYKDDKPYATCEINKQKEIKQFYKDERDRKKCNADKKLVKAMNTYLNQLNMENLYVTTNA